MDLRKGEEREARRRRRRGEYAADLDYIEFTSLRMVETPMNFLVKQGKSFFPSAKRDKSCERKSVNDGVEDVIIRDTRCD